MAEKQYHTYLAPALNSDGTTSPDQVELGRGDVNDTKSNVQHAFASVPSPHGSQHEAIISNLDEASGGKSVTRANGAHVLAKAVDLARSDDDKRKAMLVEQDYNMLLGLSPDELEAFHSSWLDRTMPGRTQGETDLLAQDYSRRAETGELTLDEVARQEALVKVLSEK